MPATASMPNLRHKSPRRFFTFSPPTLLPALPDLSPSKQRPLSPASSFSTSPRQSSFETALRPGLGVEIVRTPEEALKGMRQPKQAFSAPPGGPRSGTRPKPLLSVSSPVVPRTPRTPLSATYPRNPPKSPQKHVLPPTPFTAVLLELIRRSAGSLNQTVVTLEFAYALDEPHRSMPVSLPLEVINLAGGHLGSWIENRLDVDTDTKPELTDGESAEDSDLDSDEWGLGALLRDDFLHSLLPPERDGLKSLTPEARARLLACTSPIPASPQALRPRRAPSFPTLTVVPETDEDEVQGGVTEIRVLLLRDAGPYHHIAHRLLSGAWACDHKMLKQVREELRWLGMNGLGVEVDLLRGERSAVRRGGEGYI